MGVTAFFVCLATGRACLLFYVERLTAMHVSMFGILAAAQIEQASAMDGLPDPIVITDENAPTYANAQALAILNCKATQDSVKNLDNLGALTCVDEFGEDVGISQHLVNIIAIIDPRICKVKGKNALKRIINASTEEAKLIQDRHVDLSEDDDSSMNDIE